jgi:hypothetical protein
MVRVLVIVSRWASFIEASTVKPFGKPVTLQNPIVPTSFFLYRQRICLCDMSSCNIAKGHGRAQIDAARWIVAPMMLAMSAPAA